MPYKTVHDLPHNVKDVLPHHAKEIYKEAFNNALKQYRDRNKRRDDDASLEEVARKVAWSAVKQSYHKNNKGDWVSKQ